MDKKEEREDSVYYNLDSEDDIQEATSRLFKPPKTPLFKFFSGFFNCFSRRIKTEEELPEAEDSFAEPEPANYRVSK